MTMTLKDIMQVASDGYQNDGLVLAYFEEPNVLHGDGLAKFIKNEIQDVYSADASDDENINEAIRALSVARDELNNVLSALEKKLC